VKTLQGFGYRRGTSAVHRLDPRSKMIYVLLFAALAVYFANLLVLLLIFASSLPLVALGKVSDRWSRSIRGSLFFIVFIFTFNFIAMIFMSYPLLDAALSGISMSLRFITLISVFSAFFLTTSPEDLAQSMVQLRVPYDYALTFNMAMRFVPTLSREAQIIIDAQRSRGLELEKGSLIQRVKNYVPILIPLIISSFRRAELVADAMESRAFGASKKRCPLYVLTLRGGDYAFIAVTVVSFLLILSLRFVLGVP